MKKISLYSSKHQYEQAQTFHGGARWYQVTHHSCIHDGLSGFYGCWMEIMEEIFWMLHWLFCILPLWVTRHIVCVRFFGIQFYIRKNNPSLLIKSLYTFLIFQCKELGLKKRKTHKNFGCFLKLFEFSGNDHPVELCSSFVLFSFKYVYCMFHMPPCGLLWKIETWSDLVNWKYISV